MSIYGHCLLLCLGSKTRTATQSGYFAKGFDRIMEGEAHSDPIKRKRQDRLKEKKKQMTEQPFIPSNPSAKYSGTGSGTFSGKIEAFPGLFTHLFTSSNLINNYLHRINSV